MTRNLKVPGKKMHKGRRARRQQGRVIQEGTNIDSERKAEKPKAVDFCRSLGFKCTRSTLFAPRISPPQEKSPGRGGSESIPSLSVHDASEMSTVSQPERVIDPTRLQKKRSKGK